MFPETLYFWEIQNSAITEVAFPSKWHPSCIYTLLTVKMLETFLEAILWKTFQFFLRILNDLCSTTKCWLQSKEQVGRMGDTAVVSHCSLLRNPWPQPTGVLEHCREGDTNCWFSIFWSLLLTASLRQRRTSVCILVFTVAVPVNWTSEFRELIELLSIDVTFLNRVPQKLYRADRMLQILIIFSWAVNLEYGTWLYWSCSGETEIV
jgi:hypothetical protein